MACAPSILSRSVLYFTPPPPCHADLGLGPPGSIGSRLLVLSLPSCLRPHSSEFILAHSLALTRSPSSPTTRTRSLAALGLDAPAAFARSLDPFPTTLAADDAGSMCCSSVRNLLQGLSSPGVSALSRAAVLGERWPAAGGARACIRWEAAAAATLWGAAMGEASGDGLSGICPPPQQVFAAAAANDTARRLGRRGGDLVGLGRWRGEVGEWAAGEKGDGW
ncbi:hypothetical protein DFH27DRAFT_652702 [Peziza echinospora]|nr:hypothetical protein DFH27DRAFT_652702 [Peziza echinospora]